MIICTNYIFKLLPQPFVTWLHLVIITHIKKCLPLHKIKAALYKIFVLALTVLLWTSLLGSHSIAFLQDPKHTLHYSTGGKNPLMKILIFGLMLGTDFVSNHSTTFPPLHVLRFLTQKVLVVLRTITKTINTKLFYTFFHILINCSIWFITNGFKNFSFWRRIHSNMI